MKNFLIFSLTLLAAVISGCASNDAAVTGAGHEPRQIVDIIMDESPDSLILSIRGNHQLTPTENKQGNPKTIKLLFPATGLDGVRGRFVPPDNDIISSITAYEHLDNETLNSTITIALKSGSTYAVTTEMAGVQITFSKNHRQPEKKIESRPKPVKNKTAPPLAAPVQREAPPATVLKTVSTDVFKTRVAVNVLADGSIKKYKAFTLRNPDRYVFDLFNVKSPHRKEQKIAVPSKWIKQIRYYGHPYKLRLVIETHNHADSAYSILPSDSGLTVHVGEK